MEGITKCNACMILILQLILIILFGVFTEYEEKPETEAYPMFQDVHVMIFVGFGFLMTFLKRYGFSAVGFNFLLSSFTIQWAILCHGFISLNENNRMEIGLESLYSADIATAAVLISMGAVLGRVSYIQLLVMGIIEIAVYIGNSYLGGNIFEVSDAGGSMFVHAFGAYFGLAVSYVLDHGVDKSEGKTLEESRYTSDLFAMIGTLFLWLFWPSFNAIEAHGDDQQRAIINTYLALGSCCVTTFAMSLILSEQHKFDMVHIQNSTLAGGVAVGTAADLMIQPWGAVIVGVLAGLLSVFGYSILSPCLQRNFGIKDTCGVNNLHGMPAILAGLIGVIMASIATEESYHNSLYQIYPARAPRNTSADPEYPYLRPGDGRTAGDQALYQLAALGSTLLNAIVAGLITGLILKCCMRSVDSESFHDDAIWWQMPENENSKERAQYDNPSFQPSPRRETRPEQPRERSRIV